MNSFENGRVWNSEKPPIPSTAFATSWLSFFQSAETSENRTFALILVPFDAERSSSHTIEQLNHINALLVDQLVENQQFVESLLQLREHHQTLHSQYHQKAVRARQQIAHVNALLADQAVLQHREHQPISIQAASLEQQALFGALSDNNEKLPQHEPELVPEPEPLEASEQEIAKDISRGEQDEVDRS